jgi:two-component system osmolarity sensor histidine kinase EnvZ
MDVQPGQITRALDNLISNALRHGKRVMVRVDCRPEATEIAVEDDGPGIAVADRARASDPFVRLDPARGASHPGVGLGLAIASEVMRGHGGSLRLDESAALGGLRAVLRLPR